MLRSRQKEKNCVIKENKIETNQTFLGLEGSNELETGSWQH